MERIWRTGSAFSFAVTRALMAACNGAEKGGPPLPSLPHPGLIRESIFNTPWRPRWPL